MTTPSHPSDAANNDHEHYYGFVGVDLPVRTCMSCGYIKREDYHKAIAEAEAAGARKTFIKIHDLPSYNAMNGMDCKLTSEIERAFPEFKDPWYGAEEAEHGNV